MPHGSGAQGEAADQGAEAAAERPDGTRVPFLAYPTPLWDESDALVGAVNTLIDISERKGAEVLGQRLASIVESSDDAIVSKESPGVARRDGGATVSALNTSKSQSSRWQHFAAVLKAQFEAAVAAPMDSVLSIDSGSSASSRRHSPANGRGVPRYRGGQRRQAWPHGSSQERLERLREQSHRCAGLFGCFEHQLARWRTG
jgi:PAS domain-containing protein